MLTIGSAVAGCLLVVDTDGLATGPSATVVRDAGSGADIVDSSSPDHAGGDASTNFMSYANMILADRPIAYFRVGESSGTAAADISGHDNHGQYLSGTVLAAAGAIAGDSDTAAVVANGGVSAPTSLDFANTSPFSLEAWASFTSVPGNAHLHLFNKDFSSVDGREQFGVWVHPTLGLGFERFVASQSVTVQGPLPSAGEYHHIVSTYDGAMLALYVDAKLVGKAADTRSHVAKPVAFLVGAKAPGYQQWPGTIDEVAVYDHALSAADIARHFARGRAN